MCQALYKVLRTQPWKKLTRSTQEAWIWMDGKRATVGEEVHDIWETINRIFLGGDENKTEWRDRRLGKELHSTWRLFSGRHQPCRDWGQSMLGRGNSPSRAQGLDWDGLSEKQTIPVWPELRSMGRRKRRCSKQREAFGNGNNMLCIFLFIYLFGCVWS